MKFFKKKEKKRELTDKQKVILAENVLTDKINKMADFLESQKDWNLLDAYIVLNFTSKNSIEPQLGKKLTTKGKQILKAIEIKEKL